MNAELLKRPVYLVGAGGNARVVIDLLGRLGISPIGISDANRSGTVFNVPIMGTDADLLKQDPNRITLVNALGSDGNPSTMKIRAEVFERFHAKGFRFATLIHPSAVVAASAVLDEGCIIMAGAVVQAGARLGQNVLVNTLAQVDHDCAIGSHCHIAPRAGLSGNVSVGAKCHIGSGATVLQGTKIHDGAVVGAGALVLSDVPENALVFGVPAKNKRAKD